MIDGVLKKVNFDLKGHNIFGNFNSEEYSEVINLLKEAILSTDLSRHIQ